MEALNAILGVEIGALPTSYLGMPLGAQSESYEIWNNVVEKYEMKLTLINSVLDSLPTYMMSVVPIPKRVINKKNKIRRKFLWQGNNERRGYNLVKWDDAIVGKKLQTIITKLIQAFKPTSFRRKSMEMWE